MPSPLCVAGGGANEIASVGATVTQTATTETVHVTLTILANTVAVGTTWRFYAWGEIDNGTTAITFTPRFRWGGAAGVVLVDQAPFTSSTTANVNRAFAIGGKVSIRSVGATGTAVGEMVVAERSASASGDVTAHIENSGQSAITIDTTANKDLVLTWAMNLTTGAPVIRTLGGYAELVKA